MNTIADLLQWGRVQLKQAEFLPEHAQQREAAILLSHYLNVDHGYLYAWPEKLVSESIVKKYQAAIERRVSGEPLAYILGVKEFWSMPFKVTSDTLIPRPETEILIETILRLTPKTNLNVLELGTGSGIIACALANLRPNWHIQATDISEKALKVAAHNSQVLECSHIQFYLSDWFQSVPLQSFDLIVSNPPYVEQDSRFVNVETDFEPQGALYSGIDGLDAIRHIISASTQYLKANGLLCFEHGFKQAKPIQALLVQHGYHSIQTVQDLSGLDRVTFAYMREKST